MNPEPMSCETCNEFPVNRKRFGCGCTHGVPWTEHASGDAHDRVDGNWEHGDAKRCPQYLRRSPFCISVLSELDDYVNGRLDVASMPAPMLTYLRVAAAEQKSFKAFFEAKIHQACKSKHAQ